MEMPRWGKRGKPKTGFPPFPQRLEIACAIPTFPPPRRRFPYTEIQQVALRATVTHVAGLKCYPCSRPLTGDCRTGGLAASARQQWADRKVRLLHDGGHGGMRRASGSIKSLQRQ